MKQRKKIFQNGTKNWKSARYLMNQTERSMESRKKERNGERKKGENVREKNGMNNRDHHKKSSYLIVERRRKSLKSILP